MSNQKYIVDFNLFTNLCWLFIRHLNTGNRNVETLASLRNRERRRASCINVRFHADYKCNREPLTPHRFSLHIHSV